MANRHITRRDFMRDSGAAAAGAGLVAGMTAGEAHGAKAPAKAAGPEAAKKTRSYNPQMEYRRLGKTGLWVSAVCIGGHWKRINKVIGTSEKDGKTFEQNRHNIISRCIDVGINYIDACSGSEVVAYARALKGRRDKVFLGYSWCQKESRNAGWRTTARLLQSLDEGLKQAKLEYVDLWRITMHERSSRHTQVEVDGMIGALDKARKQGKCRFTGFSSHDRPWIKNLIENYPKQVQVILTPYTASTKKLPIDSLFESVRKHDVGVFGIKPFAGNSLFKGDSSPGSPHAKDDDRRARLAIRYILGNPAITAPIPGLISIHQVDNVVEAVKERRKLNRAEKAELQKATDQMWANLPEGYQWLKDWQYV